jgi:sialate O-acetylesterase
MKSTIILVVFVALLSGMLKAEVKPNPLFSDGAVLQRGQKIPVWGTARDGEKVTVEFQGQKATSTASGGKWSVDLDPLTAGGPFTLTLRGDNTVVLKDLLVGEVWLCSGQSNMNLLFEKVHNAAEEAPKAKYPEIRTFKVAVTGSIKPLAEAKGSWIACSPETVNQFSGVAYFFARDIHKQLRVPVGLIHSALGATPAQAWTSFEALQAEPDVQHYAKAIKNRLANHDAEAAAYPAILAEYQAKLAEWMKTTGKPHELQLAAWNEAVEKARAGGQTPPPRPRPATPRPKDPVPPDGRPTDPAVLFNGMIHPLIPFGIKGVLWYQGESNSNLPEEYQALFPALITDWRARWHQGDFPFLFVQLAPYGGTPPEIREAQFLTLGKVRNSAMTVTTDVGDATDIHPKKKEPVGQRLALAARALAYGEAIEYSGPLYESMKVESGKIILRFRHTGSGPVAMNGPLKGFTIAGREKRFVPARAEIQGNSVIVSEEGTAEPQEVRYGWENVPDVNFYNREGLPASPFRTDVK